MNKPSDDEIIARSDAGKRIIWRMLLILTGGMVLLVAAIAVAILTGHAALLANFWGQTAFAAALAVLFAFTFASVVKYYRAIPASTEPRIVRRQIDMHHRRWRIIVGVNLLTTFVCVANLSRVFGEFGSSQWPITIAIGATIVLLTVLFAIILSIGPGWAGMNNPELADTLNDEWARELRARTMRLGYILLMLLLSATLFVAILRPDLVLPALAWALYAGFAIPALYYIVADWRAGREK